MAHDSVVVKTALVCAVELGLSVYILQFTLNKAWSHKLTSLQTTKKLNTISPKDFQDDDAFEHNFRHITNTAQPARRIVIDDL